MRQSLVRAAGSRFRRSSRRHRPRGRRRVTSSDRRTRPADAGCDSLAGRHLCFSLLAAALVSASFPCRPRPHRSRRTPTSGTWAGCWAMSSARTAATRSSSASSIFAPTSVDRYRGMAGAAAVDQGLGALGLDETLAFVRGFMLFSMLANLAEDRQAAAHKPGDDSPTRCSGSAAKASAGAGGGHARSRADRARAHRASDRSACARA